MQYYHTVYIDGGLYLFYTYFLKGCSINKYAGSNSITNLKLSTLQVVVKSFYPKKLGRKQKKNIFWHKWLENLHGFANICKLSVDQTFKVMQSKICYKVVFHKNLQFCFYKFAKKFIFTLPLVV